MQSLERAFAFIHPATLTGALTYAALFAVLGVLGTFVIRGVARKALARNSVDRTAVSFLRPLAQIVLWTVLAVSYAHLIPALRVLGTALLAGASVASIVIGLAAQNTLGNAIAGLALLIYRPFRVGDRIQVMAPTGVETGMVESVSLGYTILQTFDNRRIVMPNSQIGSQTTVKPDEHRSAGDGGGADRHRVYGRHGRGAGDPAGAGARPPGGA